LHVASGSSRTLDVRSDGVQTLRSAEEQA